MRFKRLALLSGLIFIMIFTAYASIIPIYKNTTSIVPIYREVIENTAYSCYDGISKNITCYKDIPVKVFDSFKEIISRTEIIGYNIDGKDIKGFVNEQNGKVYLWDYDYGQRNKKEFGRCRQFEKDKGVCHEVN